MSNELVPVTPPQSVGVTMYRASTDAAGLCKDIVVATAKPIQGRKFIPVEGWQAIAVAHGCAASSSDVIRTEEGGYRATGHVRRMDNGVEIASAEGYVGPDEAVWFGGVENGRTYKKRHDYAIRAMAQTRAISRACRSAFAHVVVMMNAGLSTTPAEEVPPDGFDDKPQAEQRPGGARHNQTAPRGNTINAAATPAPTSDLLPRIMACKTVAEVEALRPEVAKLPKGSHERQIAVETAKAMIEELTPAKPDAAQKLADMEDDIP